MKMSMAPTPMRGQVPKEVKAERFARLMAHQQAISEKVLGRRVGKTIEVLVDEVDEEGAIARSHWDARRSTGTSLSIPMSR
jgi:ribosomal protein S12 methylthiotransferase